MATPPLTFTSSVTTRPFTVAARLAFRSPVGRGRRRFFDAELRAITAHVLLPVGARATGHVLENYTARRAEGLDMDAVHATEIRGSGWLVVPLRDPAEWTDGDADRLATALRTLRQSDYRRISDLGRFLADDSPYLVRQASVAR